MCIVVMLLLTKRWTCSTHPEIHAADKFCIPDCRALILNGFNVVSASLKKQSCRKQTEKCRYTCQTITPGEIILIRSWHPAPVFFFHSKHYQRYQDQYNWKEIKIYSYCCKYSDRKCFHIILQVFWHQLHLHIIKFFQHSLPDVLWPFAECSKFVDIAS